MTDTPNLDTVGTDLKITEDGRHLDHAAELEELGYGALWIAGGQLDRLDRISEVLDATRRRYPRTGASSPRSARAS